MDFSERTHEDECGGMFAGEARINRSDEVYVTERTPGVNIKLNEVAAGMLGKSVDAAVTVTQFAVGTALGIGQITLGTVNKWFADGTESINRQFNAMVNRIFGVRG